MKYKKTLSLFIAALTLLPLAGIAEEITTASVQSEAKILVRGQSPTGCPDTTAKGVSRLPGKWLALTQDAIRQATPRVQNNSVTSTKADEQYFFAGIPLKLGPLSNAQWTRRPTDTTARTEFDVWMGASHYRFIEWGAWSFALETIPSSGSSRTMEIQGSTEQSIPKDAYVKSAKPRDLYEPGQATIIRAVDFNGDGVVDLLLRYQSKEAEGVMLWLSDPATKRHTEVIVSATAYYDC